MDANPPAANPAPDSASPAPPTKKRRRWLQFSLRTLLLVMLVCGCGLGLLGHHIQVGRNQLDAIAWVEAQGGAVYYEELAEPLWQQRWLGNWYPAPVHAVELSETEITSLAPLRPLQQLLVLRLHGTTVPNLAPLAEHEQLHFLDLSHSHAEQEQVTRLQDKLPELIVWRNEPPGVNLTYEISSPLVRLLDERGEQLWSISLGENWRGSISSPVFGIDHSQLFLSDRKDLYAIQKETGEILWRRSQGVTSLACLEDTLLVANFPRSANNATGLLPFHSGEWVVGLHAATGEQQFAVEFAATPQNPVVDVVGAHFVVNYETPEGEAACVLDANGNLQGRVAQYCADVLPYDGALIYQTLSSVECISGEAQQRWSVSLPQLGWVEFGGLHWLDSGDLLVLNFQFARIGNIEVLRIDPATGQVKWTATCLPPIHAAQIYSDPGGYKVHFAEQGDILAVYVKSWNMPDGDALELLDAQTGEQLLRTDFRPLWRD